MSCSSGNEKKANVAEAELMPFSHEYLGSLSGQRLGRSAFLYHDIKFHRLHYRTGCLFQSESERMRPMSVLVVFRTILPHTRLATVSRQRFSFSSLTYNRRPASRGRSFGEEISMPSALASRLV